MNQASEPAIRRWERLEARRVRRDYESPGTSRFTMRWSWSASWTPIRRNCTRSRARRTNEQRRGRSVSWTDHRRHAGEWL